MQKSCAQPSCETNVLFLLIEIAMALRHKIQMSFKSNSVSLTPGKVWALHHVIRNRNLRQIALAELIGVEPMTLSVYLDRLELLQLIERRRDPSDRRLKLIEPTPQATEVVSGLEPIYTSLFREMTTCINEDQLRDLEKILQTLRSNLVVKSPELHSAG